MASLDTKIELPHFGDTIAIPTLFIEEIVVPTYLKDENGLYKKNKNGRLIRKVDRVEYVGKKKNVYLSPDEDIWVVNSIGNQLINKTRNISSRKGEKFLNLGVGEVNKIKDIENKRRKPPTLKDFPREEDRELLIHLLTHQATRKRELEQYPKNKPRGRPPILKKNWEYHGLGKLPEAYEKHKGKGKSKEKEDDKPFDWNDYPDTPESESPKENAGAGGGSGYGSPVSSPKEKTPKAETPKAETPKAQTPKAQTPKTRGRPVKHHTEEDKYKAKLQSNKETRAEKRSMEKLDKLRKEFVEIKEKNPKMNSSELPPKLKEYFDLAGKAVVDRETLFLGNGKITFLTYLKNKYKEFIKNNPEMKDKLKTLEDFVRHMETIQDSSTRSRFGDTTGKYGGYLGRYLFNFYLRYFTKEKEENEDEIEGGALIDLFNNIGQKAKQVENKIENKVKETIKGVKDYTNVVLNGRNDFQPKVRNILSKYGDKPIQSISIIRAPVPSLLTGALSALSGGKFGKNLKNSPYDTLFHLSLLISVENVKLILEKNEVINMDINPKLLKDTETQNVSISGELTINGLLENAHKSMGGKFFSYSAKDNNCQDFILAILNSNNIGNEQDKSFVKQNTKSLFDNLPSLRKISNTITDLGAKVNEITQGAGIDFDKTKWGTFTALYKRFIKEHPVFKDKIEDLEHFADFVLENKEKFSKVAEKKALFYKNIISNK
jgi:hypothetical protein